MLTIRVGAFPVAGRYPDSGGWFICHGAVHIMHRRGEPSVLIPLQVQTAQVDVLVMGTLARIDTAGYVNGTLNAPEACQQGVY